MVVNKLPEYLPSPLQSFRFDLVVFSSTYSVEASINFFENRKYNYWRDYTFDFLFVVKNYQLSGWSEFNGFAQLNIHNS